MYIYKITNKINKKIYIGKTNDIEKRIKKHLRCVKNKVNRYLYDAINYYSWENFDVEIIEECADEKANEKEKFYIQLNKSNLHEFGYNMTNGGDGGNTLKNWSNDNKKKLWKKQGNSRIGHTISDEGRKSISSYMKSNLNPVKRKDVRQKISNTLKRKYKSGELKINIPPVKSGKEHPMYGKHHTIESKQKISNARKGKTLEEIFDADTTKRLKTMRRQHWLGKNNPNYIEVDVKKALKLIYEKNGKDVAKLLNISYPTLLQKIKNYTGKTISELKNERNNS